MDLKKLKQGKTTQELLEFGIVNIDKPSGPTSFDVSDFVRNKLGLRKTSHFGTLDPKVSGVLGIALNRACKLTGFFIGSDKFYVGIMRFHEKITKKEVERIIKDKFLGKITQLPPIRSRVARKEREREIKSFKILEQNEQDFLFEVECEGGTYIRKLIHDLGEELKVGAHMLELRRIRAGIFKEEDSITLYDLEKIANNEKSLRDIIIPAEIISQVYPVVEIKEDYVSKVLHGSPIHKEFLKNRVKIEKDKIISVFCKEKFIGMFKVINSGNIFAKSEFTLQPIR